MKVQLHDLGPVTYVNLCPLFSNWVPGTHELLQFKHCQ